MSPCLEFIRHGMPEGGVRYRGNGVDDPLSPTGWQQMRDSMGDDTQWDLVISSPMKRCIEFAADFCRQHELECRVETGFTEVGFGSWEGKTKQQLRDEDETFFQLFYQDSVANRPPGAESLQDFQQRVLRVFDRLCDEHADKRVLIVGHAGIMRIVMMQVLDIPLSLMYRINIDYATRLRFEVGAHVKLLLS